MKRCYYDNTECDCDAFDVAGECPRDDLVHEEGFIDEDLENDAYELLKGLNHVQED